MSKDLSEHTTKGADNDLLDFQIEKLHESFFESGKVTGSALLTYLLMLCLTALLVFGKGLEDKVSVPLVQLTVNKTYAAALVLILSYVSFFWFLAAMLHNRLLGNHLLDLMNERYGSDFVSYWNLSYPAVHNALFIAFVASHLTLIDLLFILLFFVVLISGYALPVFFAWKIAVSLQFSLGQIILVGAGSLLFLLPSISTTYLLFCSANSYKDMIKRLARK